MRAAIVLAVFAAFALAACVTDPELGATDQAVTDDVAADTTTIELDACTADPQGALALIDETYGASSPEHAAGKGCWTEYQEELDRCDADYDRCRMLPPAQRAGCGWKHSECYSVASRHYWSCLFYRARWFCGFRWGDHTQDW